MRNLILWMPFIEGGSGADVSTKYLAEIFRSMGIKVNLQKFHSYYQFAPWLLARVKPPEGTDIILTNSWNGFAFARQGSKLVVVDRLCVHDPSLEPYKGFVQKVFHNCFVKKFVIASANAADAVVAVSDYTASLYPKVLRLAKPKVILNAVDTSFFKPLEKNHSLSDKIRILFVGNLSKRKGVDLLAPIMAELGGGFELYYTAGLRGNELQNIEQNMHKLGVLSQEQMREQYQCADILVFPSRGEGLPRAVMEALSCGTPVVSSDASSMPEAVDESVGALCPVDDVSSFVNAIQSITLDKNKYFDLSVNARNRATERFSLTRMANEYIELFDRLLSVKLECE